MNPWGTIPFVRILAAFIAGILLQLITGFHFSTGTAIIAVAAIVLFNYILKSKILRLNKFLRWSGLATQITLVILGNVLAYNAIDTHEEKHYSHFIDSAGAMLIHITEPPIVMEKTVKAVADIKAVVTGQAIRQSCGRVIIYVKNDSAATQLKYGDELLVRNKFQPIPAPKNPDDFDYRKYAAAQNIYATAYIQNGDYTRLHETQKNLFLQCSYWLREKSIYAIEKFISSPREAAVAEAMVIGDRDHLSFDTQQSFVNAGVIHIIVVAGLHVGILFLLLERIFFFLDKRKQTRLIKSLLIVLLIWVFTFLTGLSGPVLRAATMFSFIALGKNIGRSYNSFNVLACSAFSLLMFNPLFITQAGFQLSYMAVFGINTLAPYINSWLYRTNKIVDYIWKIVAASASAQIAVLPLTLHYFNQFPTYFLFANIVVIPLAVCIVWLGIALIVLQWISPLAVILGKAAGFFLYLLNEFIVRVQSLPLAVLRIGTFDWLQVLVLLLAIIFTIHFFISADKKIATTGLALILLLFVIRDTGTMYIRGQRTFSVYSIPKKSCFEFAGNGKAYFFINDTLNIRQRAYLQHHCQLHHLIGFTEQLNNHEKNTLITESLYASGHFYSFHNYRVAVISEPIKQNRLQVKKLKVNALLISGNKKLPLASLLEWFEPDIIIFDSSNSFYKVRQWKTEAAEMGVATYDVSTNGAFLKNL